MLLQGQHVALVRSQLIFQQVRCEHLCGLQPIVSHFLTVHSLTNRMEFVAARSLLIHKLRVGVAHSLLPELTRRMLR